jgi:hypothetical protein
MESDPIETARNHLHYRHTIRIGDRDVQVACLIRKCDWRPLEASWWSGKEVCIIGADTDGNFFLRHCDGGVRYWDHKSQKDSVISISVKEFVRQFRESPKATNINA